MSEMQVKSPVAVVTGAGGTLCSEIAKFLAGKKMNVILIGRTLEKLNKTADAIRAAGFDCTVAAGDVTDEARMSEIAAEVVAKFGTVDYLINGAGGNNNSAITTNFVYDPAEITDAKPAEMRGFYDLDMDVFNSVLTINTLGTVIPCRVFSKIMAANGGGAIINFASMNSYRPLTRVPAYAMSKAAIVNFTEWLATYLAPANIRVNAIAPGFFVNERSVKILRTPDGGLSERGKNVMQHTPLKRFGEAPELLGCVEWLLDNEKAGFVTGTTIPIDGGFSACSGI